MEGSSVSTFLNSIAAFMQSGGIFMWFILIMWGLGIVIALERFGKLIYRYDVDGPSFMNELQRYILSNDIQGAIRVCSGSLAALPKVLKSGLKRATSNPDQIQNAIDATALEIIPKIELRLNYLQMVANVSTLLGLLGTIQGLMTSFAAAGGENLDPAQKSQMLTNGISEAMNTTFLGLLAAISVMMIHTFLTSKADKIINEIDEFSVKLMDILSTDGQNKN